MCIVPILPSPALQPEAPMQETSQQPTSVTLFSSYVQISVLIEYGTVLLFQGCKPTFYRF